MNSLRSWMLALAGLTACGCGGSDIDTVYGRRRGAEGGASVNGVGVLAALFEAAGHKVITKRHLCPKFEQYDVVIWAPDDFAPPQEEQLQFFDNWLRRGSGRTLVYIGRDFDAAPAYWSQIQPSAPPEQAVEVRRRLSQAQAKHAQARQALPADASCPWFRVVRDQPKRQLGRRGSGPAELRGSWCDELELEPAKLDLELDARFESPPTEQQGGRPPCDSEILLASGNDVLVRRVTREDWDEGQVLVVTNGSFLLNLPLVEQEHRKLAAQLLVECGPPGSPVVFLESAAGGPPLLDKEPGEGHQTGFEPFTVWPIGAILWQFVAVGLLVLLSRMPIFGRPQELPATAVSDFGKHVQALGELLARTQEQDYARRRLAQYQEQVKREEGPR